MKPVRNMRELRLMKQKLEYQEKLYEKEIEESTADIINNLTDKFRDMAFEIGLRLVLRFMRESGKRHTSGN